VIFSPQPYEQSHAVRVAKVIDGAKHSLDIAMYSYSDARIAAALSSAVARGVKVRFLFDTAAEDRKLTGAALLASKSGRLEQQGIEVRWVNKVMHHKLMIADGPRDEGTRAATATLVTGSGNWSNGAATRYDENTLFFTGAAELVLRVQREFDLLWSHSRPIDANPALAYELASHAPSDADMKAADDPNAHVYCTSANFSVNGTTFRTEGRNELSDALVAAIAGAKRSIHVASGHLRSRPVSEALMARTADGLDIRVYLDGQEYVSASFGYAVARTGIAVRYKYYAYRWDASYAEQMHHKYLIIDGETLYTGSYNLSDNAEHDTIENMLRLGGTAHARLVAAFEDNFERLWDTGRVEGRLAALRTQIAAGGAIPLVFPPMALDHAEITKLKSELRAACPAADSEPYRTDPPAHQRCN
jgi:phosphatidylserine/phosphatidylglycerophosphate/cardiolipin synthase-like enzyme